MLTATISVWWVVGLVATFGIAMLAAGFAFGKWALDRQMPTPTIPAQPGDAIAMLNVPETATVPAGWTRVGTTLFRIADGTESALFRRAATDEELIALGIGTPEP